MKSETAEPVSKLAGSADQQVPSRWPAIALKRGVRIVNGATPKSDVAAYWDGDVVWVTPADLSKVNGGEIRNGARALTEAGYHSCGTTLVPEGSVILSTRAPIGTLALAATSICTNQGCKSLVPTRLDSKFLLYALSIATKELNIRGRGTTFLELPTEELGTYRIANPTFEEQVKIARFLDHETAKIDRLIDKQQQLIALLKEKRQAVISHAVTKGLNPDVPMKDSGVEWLGYIPAHWTTSCIKHLASVIDCKHITAEFVDDGIPVASIAETKGWSIDLSSAKKTTIRDYRKLIGGGRDPRVGDIILTRNATVGQAAVVPAGMPPFAMGQDVCLIRPSSNADPSFVLHFLKSPLVGAQLDLAMIGSTFKRVNVEDVRELLLPFPPTQEQALISEELGRRIPKYDALVEAAESVVFTLNERRVAIISAAVTGKIDVREWQQPIGAEDLQ